MCSGLPRYWLKCSKNMAKNAATSFAASNVVLCMSMMSLRQIDRQHITDHRLTVVSIRVSNPDRLVYEYHVCVTVP